MAMINCHSDNQCWSSFAVGPQMAADENPNRMSENHHRADAHPSHKSYDDVVGRYKYR